MELPRITDLAARQAIDSTRLFKEYVRVRRELETFEGSQFFKKVGPYEYLLHKVGDTVHRKGKRSPETEAQRAQFQTTKSRLKARLKVLKESVETNQRMNKAVQVGAVPTEIIEVLSQLEEHGLADKSVVVGWPALYAYSQSSGVKLDHVKLWGTEGKLLTRRPDELRVLIKAPADGSKERLRELWQSLKTVADIETSASRDARWLQLLFRFSPSSSKTIAKSKYKAHFSKSSEKGQMSPRWPQKFFIETTVMPTQRAAHLEAWTKLLTSAPPYEQVVVGKTGRMAMMRTLDPKLFVSLEQARQRQGMDSRSRQTAEPVRLVEEMLEASMLITKLEDAATEVLNEELLALAATDEALPNVLEALPTYQQRKV